MTTPFDLFAALADVFLPGGGLLKPKPRGPCFPAAVAKPIAGRKELWGPHGAAPHESKTAPERLGARRRKLRRGGRRREPVLGPSS